LLLDIAVFRCQTLHRISAATTTNTTMQFPGLPIEVVALATCRKSNIHVETTQQEVGVVAEQY